MEFSKVVAFLKKVPKPVTLLFRPAQINERSSFIRQNSGPSDQPALGSIDRAQDSLLRINSTSSIRNSNQYELNWQEGSLGLSLHAADETSDYPFITRVTGIGCAAHLPNSVLGDQLVSINGSSVSSRRCTFLEVMDKLKTLPKPVSLKFMSRDAQQLSRSASSTNGRSGGIDSSRRALDDMDRRIPNNSNHTLRSKESRSYDSSRSAMDFGREMRRNGSREMDKHAGLVSNGSSRNILASDRGLESHGGDDTKFSQLHTPFLGGPKLSSGRRQKIVKQLKK